jgi:glycosyltransferase involved in cell wall biosynthesis
MAIPHKIFLSGTNGLPGKYGGWDQLLSHLSLYLSENYCVTVHTSVYDSEPGLEYHDGAFIKIINLSANGASSIIYDFVCLWQSLINRGTCVMLGTSGGLFFPLFRALGLKIILNPDGEEWNRSKWPFFTKVYLYLSDLIANSSASAVIADHPRILQRVAKLRRKRLYYIPYGGDNAQIADLTLARSCLPCELKPLNYIFSVCRIEPENNVHITLEAASIANLPLVFIGNWNRSQYGRRLLDRYSNYQNIILLQPIYDPVVLGAIRSNCNLYIHGHTVGGTNPSLVEALCLGLRIICHDNKFNRDTTDNSCLYFNSSTDLVRLMIETFEPGLPHDVNQRALYLKKYAWQNVTSAYEKVIKDVII